VRSQHPESWAPESPDGKWRVVRQLGGDDTGQGEILTLRANTVLRVTVYRYE
jgi:hypothetical protein